MAERVIHPRLEQATIRYFSETQGVSEAGYTQYQAEVSMLAASSIVDAALAIPTFGEKFAVLDSKDPKRQVLLKPKSVFEVETVLFDMVGETQFNEFYGQVSASYENLHPDLIQPELLHTDLSGYIRQMDVHNHVQAAFANHGLVAQS
ncbi:MAG TPA: hypothetical protein VLE91_02415 [Candidatus Saccharimonadales bacterium]|nr:hypothetical protein [Candidatus Saccharimonadales bacterium]